MSSTDGSDPAWPPPAPQPDGFTDASVPPADAPPVEASARNTFGRASLILAGVVLLVGVLSSVASYVAPLLTSTLALDYSAYAVIFVPFQVVTVATAVAGLVLGIIGLRRAGLPRGAAGAGTGIAAVTLLRLLADVILGLVATFAY